MLSVATFGRMHRLWIGLLCGSLACCTKELKIEGPETSGPESEANKRKSARLDATESASSIERITSDPGDEIFPTVNREGTLVLFQVEAYGAGAERKLASQTIHGIEPAKHGGRALYTTEGRAASQPSFMPDGQSFVYVSNALGPLAIVRAASAVPSASVSVVIASDLAPELGEPAVSPDGARIAFSMKEKSGARWIAVVGVDGSRLTLIGEGRAPAWSPAGDRLAFVRTVQGFNHLFTIDSSFGGLKQITQGSFDCDKPTFSPDGRFLAFASNRGFEQLRKDRSEVLQLFVVGLDGPKTDGTDLTQITRGAARAATPAWGADGWIYFSSDREESLDLYRVRPAGELATLKPVQVLVPSAPPPASSKP